MSNLFQKYEHYFSDCEFTTSNDTFSVKCKLFYKTNNKKPKYDPAIEKVDMNILQHYFSNSPEDPAKLQEFLQKCHDCLD